MSYLCIQCIHSIIIFVQYIHSIIKTDNHSPRELGLVGIDNA